MKRLKSSAGTTFLLLISLLAVTASIAVAQVRNGVQKGAAAVEDEIPPEALQTEEGRRMVERLRFLRRSQMSIGPKHPAFPGMESEIESIRGRLGLSSSPGNSVESELAPRVEGMGDEELRQLIRRMALRIEFLEKRVDSLERRLEIF